MTWLLNPLHDNKISPQGLQKGFFQVPQVNMLPPIPTQEQPNNPPNEAMESLYAALVEEQTNIDENEDDGILEMEEERDDGSEIDDKPNV